MVNWKFWKKEEKKEEKNLSLYPSKELVAVTTEADINLIPCKVSDDHKISFKFQGQKKSGKIMRQPHILHINLWTLLPGWKPKLLLGRLLFPRYLRFLQYTIRKTGEVTHDPHDDLYEKEDKMRFENMLKLEGKFAEARAGEIVYEGMKGKKKWEDYIPYLVILGIVFLFLFSFQIGPNM